MRLLALCALPLVGALLAGILLPAIVAFVLGWFIFRSRNELFTDRVFAGLAAVILIGLLVEAVIFRGLESATVRRWGVLR